MDTVEQSRTYEAIRARDAAHVRLRRFTGGAVAVAVGLSAVFAALAANATHAKKTIVRSPAKGPLVAISILVFSTGAFVAP